MRRHCSPAASSPASAPSHTAGLRPARPPPSSAAGGVGLNSVQGAAISGARMVIALDVVEGKLEAARPLRRHLHVNAGAPDAIEQVRRLTGRGADYVFVTVGAKAAIPQALAMAARSGTVVLVGMPASGVTVAVDPGDIAHNNLRVLARRWAAPTSRPISQAGHALPGRRLKTRRTDLRPLPAGKDQRGHRLGPQRRRPAQMSSSSSDGGRAMRIKRLETFCNRFVGFVRVHPEDGSQAGPALDVQCGHHGASVPSADRALMPSARTPSPSIP